MKLVHVFASTENFASEADLTRFVGPTYTPDGEEIPSRFGNEVGLSSYEPACIECMVSDTPSKISDLLSGVSYGRSWAHAIGAEASFCAAVCIFPPNLVATPERSSIQYLGAYEFED